MAASASASLVSTLVDGSRLSSFSRNQQKLPLPQCVSLPPLPLRTSRKLNGNSSRCGVMHSTLIVAFASNYTYLSVAVVLKEDQSFISKLIPQGGRFAKTVVTMATGESLSSRESTSDVETELPEALKSIQEAWDRLDDKYAIASLGIAGIIALWGSTGLISAIDRLPLVPGVLELVGIGYTGWFAYQNLFFKPDREALLAKIKCTLDEIIGSI